MTVGTIAKLQSCRETNPTGGGGFHAFTAILEQSKGPGPEVPESENVSQGPCTIKVQFFCRPSEAINGKLRILRTLEGQLRDESLVFSVEEPGDVAEIGVFAAE